MSQSLSLRDVAPSAAQQHSRSARDDVDGDDDGLPSDHYLHSLASYIKNHSERLSSLTDVPDKSWSSALLLSSSTLKPITLTLSLYHLYYILLKIQEAGFADVGNLDVPVTDVVGNSQTRRPAALAQVRADKSDAVSTKTGWSYITTGAGSIASSWWSASPASSSSSSSATRPDPVRDLKIIYTAFTLLPSLRLVMNEDAPSPTSATFSTSASRKGKGKSRNKEISGFPFADYPGDRMVPMRAFKSLQRLELQGLDARVLLFTEEWKGIKVLQVRDAGIEELGELLLEPPTRDYTSHDEEDEGSASGTKMTIATSRIWQPVLRILDLQDNDLTSLDSSDTTGLERVHSLNLRKNLLISVPTSLANLSSLRSLDLSANMIDSVIGIYKSLGNLTTLNLRTNRISSLCGLERLLSLEILDLRNNLVYDVSELSRLSVLPQLKELYISHGNPFLEELALEANPNLPEGTIPSTTSVGNKYRIDLFNTFLREGNMDKDTLLSLDGYKPTWSERRQLSTEAYKGAGTSGFAAIQADRISRGDFLFQGNGTNGSGAGAGAGAGAGGNASGTTTPRRPTSSYSYSFSGSKKGRMPSVTGQKDAEARQVFVSPRARRMRNASSSSVATTKSVSRHKSGRHAHEVGAEIQDGVPPVPVIPKDLQSPITSDFGVIDAVGADKDGRSSGNGVVAMPSAKPKVVKRKHRRVVDLDAGQNGTTTTTTPISPTSPGSSGIRNGNEEADLPASAPVVRRHERSVSTPGLQNVPEDDDTELSSHAGASKHHTISTQRKPSSRSRLSLEAFSPPPPSSSSSASASATGREHPQSSDNNTSTEVDEFRKKIERLRDEVGVENWLSVYAAGQGNGNGNGNGKSKGAGAGAK